MEKLERKKPHWIEHTTHSTRPVEGRHITEYEKTLGFKKENLEGKTVLDLGSGPTELLSREIEKAGLNTKVISLNPDYKTPGHRQPVVDMKDWLKKSVAGIGQELPFPDNTFDEVFALYSVSWYVDFGFIDVLKEVIRVLKPSGTARIAPFMIERWPYHFDTDWQKDFPETIMTFEECDEHWEEGILLRLIIKKK